MKISLVAFDDFTDIDLFLMWDLLNRVRQPDGNVSIVGEKAFHLSSNGLRVSTQMAWAQPLFRDGRSRDSAPTSGVPLPRFRSPRLLKLPEAESRAGNSASDHSGG